MRKGQDRGATESRVGGHEAGRRLGSLDPQPSAPCAAPPWLGSLPPGSSPGPEPGAPLPGAHGVPSAGSRTCTLFFGRSRTPRACRGRQAVCRVLQMPYPVTRASVPRVVHEELREGAGLAQGHRQRAAGWGPELWRASAQSLPTRFPKPPPLHVLAPASMSSATARSGLGGPPEGTAPPSGTVPNRRSRSRAPGWWGLTVRQALATGSCLRPISSRAGGPGGGTEARCSPSPCFMQGEARPGEGRHAAPSHTAAERSGAWRPVITGW